MTTIPPRTLFLEFRDNGNTQALADLFDAVAPELLRTALRISPPHVAPEDVVQATLLRAIEIAARFDPDRPLLPWLRGISRIVAQEESRRLHVAEIAAPEPAPPETPLQLAQRREVLNQILERVQALPEPQRSVLAPYLLAGETPSAIAARSGVPVGTVKSRINRGLAALRSALPPALGVAIAALAANPVLGGARNRLLIAAGRQQAEAAVTGALRPRTLLTRSLLMGAAVLVAALWGWPSDTASPPAQAMAARTASLTSATENPEGGGSVHRTRDVEANPGAVIGGVLFGATARANPSWSGATVRLLEARSPVPAIDLSDMQEWAEQLARSGRDAGAVLARDTVATDGSFSLRSERSVREGWLVLDHDHRALAVPVPWVAFDSQPLSLPTYEGALIHGAFPKAAERTIHLRVEPGPIPPDSVTALSFAACGGKMKTRANREGGFRFPAVWCTGRITVWADIDGARWTATVAKPDPGDVVSVILTPGVRTTTLVHVYDANGAALPGATVEAYDGFDPSPVAISASGDDGMARFDKLAAGKHRFVAQSEGAAPAECHVQIRPGQQHVHLRSPVGSLLTGTVVDAEGEPVAGATVSATARLTGGWLAESPSCEYPILRWVQPACAAELPRAVVAETRTDAEGAFRLVAPAKDLDLDVVPPAARSELASRRGVPSGGTIVLAERTSVRAVLRVPEDARSKSVIVRWRGLCAPQARVLPVPEDSVPEHDFELGIPPEGAREVELVMRGGWSVRADLPAPLPESLGILGLTRKLEYVVRVQDSDGTVAPGARVTWRRADLPMAPPLGAARTNDQGEARVPVLASGAPLRVDVASDAASGGRTLVGAPASDGAEIVKLAPWAELLVSCPGAAWVALVNPASPTPRAGDVEPSGQVRFTQVPPGRYLIAAAASPQAQQPEVTQRVELLAGETTSCDLELRGRTPARTVRVRVLGAPENAYLMCLDDGVPATIELDASGRAELAVPDGQCNVVVLDSEGMIVASQAFVEGVPDRVLFDLRHPSLRGSVAGGSSQDFVLAHRVAGGERPTVTESPSATASIRDDGTFTLHGLAPGRYRLLVMGTRMATALVDHPGPSLSLTLSEPGTLRVTPPPGTDAESELHIHPGHDPAPLPPVPLQRDTPTTVTLPPGSYTLRRGTNAAIPFTIHSGQQTAVQL